MLRLIVLAWVFGSFSYIHAQAPSILYLTWVDDPARSMVIHWHTKDSDKEDGVLFRVDKEGGWKLQDGQSIPLGDADDCVHVVKLIGLEPDCRYAFKIVGDEGEYYFHTMPSTLHRQVRFVIGGDAYCYLKLLQKMNRQVAKQDPDFVVVGGDIAYAYGRSFLFQGKNKSMKRWRQFLREWTRQMIRTDGSLIPLLPVIGNHDVKGKSADQMIKTLFAFPEGFISYRAVDFGDYLSLVLLDTGHLQPVNGDQLEWLDQTLQLRKSIAYKMAVYHVGGYPSVYPYEGSMPSQIRKNWSPVFERYRVQLAFEHHNHAYKRTYPIKNNQIDMDGVIYMGDGSWGVAPRRVKNKKMWYVEKAKKINAVCVITLGEDESELKALSMRGDVIDQMAILKTAEGI